LVSVVVGYDAMGRAGEAVMLPRIRNYFHGTGTAGVFGSTAAAGRLLGLDVRHLVNAFGIAGDGASGLKEFQSPPYTGLDCKPLHAGRASEAGITAAYLAADGFEGSATIFEGDKGFCRAVSTLPRPELVCDRLGERFAVLESGFKIHPCPGGNLAVAADAAVWLCENQQFDPQDIRRIKVGVPAWMKGQGFERLTFRRPATLGQARFSVPYVVAAALNDGGFTLHQMTEDKLMDPRVAALEERLEIIEDPEVDAISDALTREDPYYFAPISVAIEVDGQEHRRLERTPIGYDPNRALTDAQVVTKFHSMVDDILTPASAERVIAWVQGLDRGSRLQDAAGLFDYANGN
jgi:2-methylcitrate dehydratase PrpD